MKTVTISGLAASHGASAPASAVCRDFAARERVFRSVEEFGKVPAVASSFFTAMKAETNRR
jgi:hypothetical protein